MQIIKKDTIKKDIINEINNGEIVGYSEGYFLVLRERYYYYFINAKTKEEIGPFTYAYPFKNGYAPVEFIATSAYDSYCGYIDKKGNRLPIKQNKSHSCSAFSDGYVKVGDKSFSDEQGNIKDYKPYNILVKFVSSFKCGRAVVTCEIFGKRFYYYIDKKFKRISKNIYDVAVDYCEERALVGKGKKRFIIDEEENIIFEYDLKNNDKKTASRYSEDLLGYHENFKWGFLDKEGNVAIKPQLEYQTIFSDSVTVYKDGDDDNFYIIDKKGNKKIILSEENCRRYNKISDFKKGYALLSPYNDLIDKEGNITKLEEDVTLYEDYLVLSDKKSFIKLEDLKRLKKEYQIIIRRKDKENIKTFESERKRDEYYNMLQQEKNIAVMVSRMTYNEKMDKLFEDPDKRYEELHPKKGRPRIRKDKK